MHVCKYIFTCANIPHSFRSIIASRHQTLDIVEFDFRFDTWYYARYVRIYIYIYMQMILMFKGSEFTRQMSICSSNLSAIHRNHRNLWIAIEREQLLSIWQMLDWIDKVISRFDHDQSFFPINRFFFAFQFSSSFLKFPIKVQLFISNSIQILK